MTTKERINFKVQSLIISQVCCSFLFYVFYTVVDMVFMGYNKEE